MRAYTVGSKTTTTLNDVITPHAVGIARELT
jgi:hypothetical protein